jgi:5-methylcytosine-specific restriction endonuclease McrA
MPKKGTHNSPSTEFKRGNVLSEETKHRMSISRTGGKLSAETKLKISISHKGKRLSDEHIKKLSEVKKGKTLSEEHKQKISRRLLDRWDGIGRKEYKRPLHQGSNYQKWRRKVWEKDNYTCQKCFVRCGNGERVYIEAHHISAWSNHQESRFDVSNGITLCHKCHKLEHGGKVIELKGKDRRIS